MVVRRGLRAWLAPLALYCLAFAAAGFFVKQAEQGQRGLDAKKELGQEEDRILAEYRKLQRERGDWERKVALFRADALDKDLLDERVRRVLNRVHRDEVVIVNR
ncbi:MAG: hypothetical protein BGP06_05915 [Rhizobiales bacterium 65-9]|nr:septum formation initiator family protein [Hyphomicrobiales bacterium]OJY35400.1 MAG: hypothetical protein BGP06_05915 [Rhizobiales bacterium 65-9]